MKRAMMIFRTLAVLTVLAASAVQAAGVPQPLDPATVSRLDMLVNQKRLIGREIVGTNIVYTFRQGGNTWCETNAVRHIDGTIQPTRYSRLKLYAVLARMGLWPALETWLKSQTVEGVNAYTAFMIANDLRSDHPLFMQYFTAAKQALGIDDATADLILAQAEE